MKDFLKMTFASIIGMVIAGFVLLIMGISVIGGMVATTEVATVVKENSVFVLDLKGSVVERYEENPFEQLMGEEITTRGLEDILASIEKAKNDPKIKGMLINAEVFACSTLKNNCGTFAADVLKVDDEVKEKAPSIIDPRPNSMVEEFQDEFKPIKYDPNKK